MAKPTTLSAAKLLILVGNGASPEVFAAPCGLTTKGINFSKETNDVTVYDCDDPDAPAWVERIARSFSGTVSGSGILAMESLETWREFFESSGTKNVRIKLDTTLANNGGHWSGAFHCTSFNVTGEIGDKIQVEVELQNNGAVTWTDAAA